MSIDAAEGACSRSSQGARVASVRVNRSYGSWLSSDRGSSRPTAVVDMVVVVVVMLVLAIPAM